MTANVITPNIDFAVKPKPVVVGGRTVDGYQAAVRVDTGETLAINGSRYKIVDHRKNIELVAKALQRVSPDFQVKHTVENARIYSRFTLTQEGLLPNDRIEGATLALDLQNSYDGSLMFGFAFSVWRQVCSNGMFGFRTEKRARRLHTAGINVNSLIKGITPAIIAYKNDYTKLYSTLKDKTVIPTEKLEEKFTQKLISQARENYAREYAITKTHNAWTQLNSFTRSLSHDDKISEGHRQELSRQVTALFLNYFQIAG